MITMKDLKPTGEYLGKGASGQVELYHWNTKQVAVKLIHGVTSDGRAEDELAIYSAVGSSGASVEESRVVGCLALFSDVNTGKNGVVMERLPSTLVDLALPPTIQEVTIDRYEDQYALAMSPSMVYHALKDAVTAMQFLHEHVGVAHGDVYAHNMKVDREGGTGRVFLLDFGASYFTGGRDGNGFGVQAERLEVRSFGILIQELLNLIDVGEDTAVNEWKNALMELCNQCMDENVEKRPSLAQIKKFLSMNVI